VFSKADAEDPEVSLEFLRFRNFIEGPERVPEQHLAGKKAPLRAFFVFGEHARELISPESGLAFFEGVVKGEVGARNGGGHAASPTALFKVSDDRETVGASTSRGRDDDWEAIGERAAAAAAGPTGSAERAPRAAHRRERAQFFKVSDDRDRSDSSGDVGPSKEDVDDWKGQADDEARRGQDAMRKATGAENAGDVPTVASQESVLHSKFLGQVQKLAAAGGAAAGSTAGGAPVGVAQTAGKFELPENVEILAVLNANPKSRDKVYFFCRHSQAELPFFLVNTSDVRAGGSCVIGHTAARRTDRLACQIGSEVPAIYKKGDLRAPVLQADGRERRGFEPQLRHPLGPQRRPRDELGPRDVVVRACG